MEYGKVRPRCMAPQPESWAGHGLAELPFRGFGGAEAVHQGIISTEPPWYVIRMSVVCAERGREASPYAD